MCLEFLRIDIDIEDNLYISRMIKNCSLNEEPKNDELNFMKQNMRANSELIDYWLIGIYMAFLTSQTSMGKSYEIIRKKWIY